VKEAVRKFKETIEIRSSILNRLRTHRYFPLTVLVLTVLLASFVHIWQRVRVIELVKEVSHLEHENKSLVDDYKKTYSEIASLSMATRIEAYARDTLGMRPVSADHLYTLIPDKNVPHQPDEFSVMVSAIQRVARYMPVVSENEAGAAEIRLIKFDSVGITGGAR
jgi:cell division protein FtsL